MPMLINPATAAHDEGPVRSGRSFRVRLAAAIAATVPDGRPFAIADRASAATHRYRAMA